MQYFFEIALLAGYETQQSFTIAFKTLFKCSPQVQPVADYIYKEWFPQSTCQLNESARYDFARYGELVDEKGESLIEYWLPIL